MAQSKRSRVPSPYALVQKFPDGWYYRLGSGPSYPWLGPFETEHVAKQVREGATGGPWGTQRKPSRSHATMRGSKAGTWAVEAGRGLTYDRGDGRGPLLMFNLHRHVLPRTGGSYINPVDLDEIAHEISSFLNRKKRKLKPSHTDPGQ
jgi:hypothetical protein